MAVTANNFRISPHKNQHHMFHNMSSPQESFAFHAITREKYYQIHGEHRTQPKNGNYYPRFDLLEK